MSQNNEIFNIGFNIHLLSFSIPRNIIKYDEDIRVSITTLPEECKQNFYLPCEKMENSNHVFAFNITNQTTKIVMVFRKKNSMANDPIIASSTIHRTDFPRITADFAQMCSGTINTEVKEFKIYEPLHKQYININTQRKVIGTMKIQFSFTTPYPENKETKNKNNNNNQKLFKFKPFKIKPIDFKNFDFKSFDFSSKNEDNIVLDTKYDLYEDYQLF